MFFNAYRLGKLALNHTWHGIDVLIVIECLLLAALISLILGLLAVRNKQKRRAWGALIAAAIFSTAAWAANTALSGLSAGSSVAGTDLFYDVQTPGTGGVKVTAAQVATYVGTTSSVAGSISVGCGAVASPSPIVTPGSGTISAADPSTVLTSANPPILSSYCGGTVYLNNGSNQIPTIARAGTAGFTSGVPFKVCNIGAGTQTLTPTTSTIGGASTYVLAAGTQAAPICVGFQSDGTNYLVNYETGGSSGSGTITAGTTPTSGITSGDLISSTSNLAADSGVAVANLMTLSGAQNVTGVKTFADGDVTLSGSSSGASVLHAPATGGGAVTFFAGSDTVAGLATNQIFSGVETFSAAGTASVPAISVTGLPFAGNGTTSTPQLYMNGGTAPSTYAVGGTYFGINAASGFGGNAIDIHQNGGSSVFSVSAGGNVSANGNLTATAGLVAGNTSQVTWAGRGILTSSGANVVQLGATASATPASGTFQVSGSRSGTDTNVGGGNLTVTSGNGTGTGTVSTITFQAPVAVGSGTGAQTLTTAMVLGGGTVSMPNLAASSAATTGTVCWTTGGNLTVDTTLACLASLEELKDIHGPIDGATALVSRLEPFWYSWKEGTNQRAGDKQDQPGFGAHQVAAVDSRLVSYSDDGKLLGVRYQQMTALLAASVKELNERIAQLEHPYEKPVFYSTGYYDGHFWHDALPSR